MFTLKNLLILLIIILVFQYKQENLTEYAPCDAYAANVRQTGTLNPYVWPYSGTSSIAEVAKIEQPKTLTPISPSQADHIRRTG